MADLFSPRKRTLLIATSRDPQQELAAFTALHPDTPIALAVSAESAASMLADSASAARTGDRIEQVVRGGRVHTPQSALSLYTR